MNKLIINNFLLFQLGWFSCVLGGAYDNASHNRNIDGWEIEDLTSRHTDLEYIYYVWQTKNKLAYISIFERTNYSEESWHLEYEEKDLYTCIFVGEPLNLIRKYKLNTNEEG